MTIPLFVLSFALLLIGYLINMFMITVMYHRALTHKALALTPFATKLIQYGGNWLTGIDPKAWACMHRLHHIHSDTSKDPHSPLRFGVLGVAYGQLISYKKILIKLLKNDPEYTKIVNDIPFGVSVLNRKNLWYLPYVLHVGISVGLSFFFDHWIVGVGFFLGIMSHPVQGWMVNSLAHKYGYRNYNLDDNSKNNLLVSILTCGEGYQNNHHAKPTSPRFSHKKTEVDIGYAMAKVAIGFGLLRTV